MNTKRTIIILLYSILLYNAVSCKREQQEEYNYLDLSKSSILNSSETLYEFYDSHPVSITVKDSIMFIIQVQSNICLIAFNLNSKKIVNYFGRLGQGPNEVLRPSFITSIDGFDVLIEDVNTKKIMKINKRKDNEYFDIDPYIEYPIRLYPSDETNFSTNFITGRMMDRGEMLYIYSKTADSLIHVNFYPIIKHLKNDLNYVYASRIGLNEEKNRIVLGMSFFDLFGLYDLSGKRINTSCFSKNCIPKFESDDINQDLKEGHSRIVRVFPTNDYCYLLRYTNKSVTGEYEKTFIQLNWDGKLINSYKMQDDITGGRFYVDEKERKLYAIRHYINMKEEEIYAIASFQLN
jgi:hypothetical protein